MHSGKPQLLLFALLVVWLILAAPQLWQQFSQTSQMRTALAGRSAKERRAYFDNPSFQAAEVMAGAVPKDACLVILAYAGNDASEYYRARFRYDLYPREVHLFNDSSAAVENCSYVAVFRDSPQNLARSPFAGSWDSAVLQQRLSALRRVAASESVDVYRVP